MIQLDPDDLELLRAIKRERDPVNYRPVSEGPDYWTGECRFRFVEERKRVEAMLAPFVTISDR